MSLVKTKVDEGNALLAVHIIANGILAANKAERFRFKSGRAVRVAKRLKEDWLLVLQ